MGSLGFALELPSRFYFCAEAMDRGQPVLLPPGSALGYGTGPGEALPRVARVNTYVNLALFRTEGGISLI